MKTSDFDYELPQELIAQEPPEIRGTEKMMVLHRASGDIEHRSIADIGEYLNAGDLLVVNDTKVFPARLLGTWSDTGGAVELLLLEPEPMSAPPSDAEIGSAPELCRWRCIYGSGRRVRPGQVAVFGAGALRAEIAELSGEGVCSAVFGSAQPLMSVLDAVGRTPVPPYIRRDGSNAELARLDRERYQTIYARETGAVAAPTAGLHFTPEIFADLERRGVERTALTLHVGPGTFKPVKVERVEEHVMDAERYRIGEEAAAAIAACRERGGRVVAVGSTSVRTLETSASLNGGRVAAGEGSSSIFIYPPFEFKAVDAMLTNFHLPQSTLIMMVSALAGRETILRAYRQAVDRGYRFFSYGDCMLIL